MSTLRCRPRLTGMAATLLLLVSGCAHRPAGPPPLAAEIQAQLGTIGIVQQGMPWLEWPAKPARGAGAGAVQGAAFAWTGAMGSPYGLALAPVLVTGNALLGSVTAPPARAVARTDQALDDVLADPAYLTALRDRIGQLRQAHSPQAFVLLPPRDPTLDHRKSPYAYPALARQGVETLLEIGGPTVRLIPTDFAVPFTEFAVPINPILRQSVLVTIRLVRTRDGEVLHTASFVHRGDTHTFTGWGAADASRFRNELTHGFDALGQQIVDHLFGPPASPSHYTQEPVRASVKQ